MTKLKGKCQCKPKRRGPMTVKVKRHRRNGTMVKSHKRHKPKTA